MINVIWSLILGTKTYSSDFCSSLFARRWLGNFPLDEAQRIDSFVVGRVVADGLIVAFLSKAVQYLVIVCKVELSPFQKFMLRIVTLSDGPMSL